MKPVNPPPPPSPPSVTIYLVNIQPGGDANDLHLHVGGNGPPPIRFWSRVCDALGKRLLRVIGQ